jgi:putative colanic acid biosynthesis acetyltransferase WcaF
MNPKLSASPYSTREKIARVLWACVQASLFRLSFHSWYGWRRLLLRTFGAKLDPVCRIRRTVRIECPWNLTVGHDSAVGDGVILYCLGSVTIGDRVTVSQGAHLCAGTHDYTLRSMPLLRPAILVGNDAWICADAFVGPGVTVGDGAILGARAVAMRDLQAWTIHSGNPAQAIRARPAFVD